MPRIGTMAAVMGVVAGSWVVATYFLGCASPVAYCTAYNTGPPGVPGILAAGVAGILILASFVAFVGPRVLFYGGAVLCAAVDLLELANYSVAPGIFYSSLLLVTLALVLDVIAARKKTWVSEQSHPMNLPVFG